jgi:Ulp1 family protease
VNNIQASTQQQFLKHQINLSQSVMQEKDLDAFLQQLGELQWLDNMFGEEEEDFFRSKHEEILAQMKGFEERQREACKKVYGKSDFCQLIQILMIFQSLGKRYAEQS